MLRYAALGSSFAAGPGIPPTIDPVAGRSGNNYPHLLAARLGLDLIDATVAGSTTAELLAHQLPHLPADTDLVTITSGGNDLDYVGSVIQSWYSAIAQRQGWLDRWLAEHEGALARDPAESIKRAPQVRESLARVVQAVRDKAPGARIVLVDYLTLLGPDVGDAPLSDQRLALLRRLAEALAEATAGAARDSGSLLVRASAASHRHGVGSTEPWVVGEAEADMVPFHPNRAGMSAVADLIAESL